MARNAFPVVFDGHNDVLLRLGAPGGGGPGAFFERNGKGHLDLPRAREGGFGVGFFAVWIPSPREQTPEPTPDVAPTSSVHRRAPFPRGVRISRRSFQWSKAAFR